MNKVRVLIVDDEPLAREGVALMLQADSEVEVIGQCADGRSALREIRAQRPDLVLLDVQMPQTGGLEVVEQLLPKERPAFIFVSAHNEYAVKAFEMCAVDYLLKPFRDQRLWAAMARAKEHLRRADLDEMQRRATELLQHLRGMEAVGAVAREPAARRPIGPRLVLKVGGEHVFVATADISWLEAHGDGVKLGTGRQVLFTRESLQSIEKQLDSAVFIRIHRSFIVNAGEIKKITPTLYGDHVVLTNDGAKIRLSRTYRDKLKVLLSSRPA